MKKLSLIFVGLLLACCHSFGQTNHFVRLKAMVGDWSGTGSGFGNNKSQIESSCQLVMGGQYLEIKNESRFDPTERNPEGEHHIDRGFISYDKSRDVIVYRQFNNEGYVNQYVLNDSLSNDSLLVFDTEVIENFVPGGKARWTVKILSDNQIETSFEVSFPKKDYTCFGVNKLTKKK
ncbi:hypothetical protein [Ancylomarina subtilis]|nr:hypothetical protein [Ancylomarina subtilis]